MSLQTVKLPEARKGVVLLGAGWWSAALAGWRGSANPRGAMSAAVLTVTQMLISAERS